MKSTKRKGNVRNAVLGTAAGFAVGLIVGLTVAPRGNAPAEPRASSSPSQDIRAELSRDNILIRLNEERIANGLGQAGTSEDLASAAQVRADEMESRDYCGHDGLEKAIKPLFRSGYRVGELLFCGSKNSTEVINGLAESPTHREAMNSKELHSVGVGFKDDTVVILMRLQDK